MSEFWTAQEDNRLLFLVGIKIPSTIARHLDRTPRSVIDRYKRIHGGCFTRATARAGGMSVLECAQALGIKHARIRAWIRYGWLKASKRIIIERQLYTVGVEDLEAFLGSRGALLEGLQPTDPYWAQFVQQARASLLARYIEGGELSVIFCLDRKQFGSSALGTRAGFPPAAFYLQGRECWFERAAIREWLAQAPDRYRTAGALRAFGANGRRG